jgi:phosphohistidine phosphatase
MDLYVIRHAIAEPRSLELPDEDRDLTKKGRDRFEMVSIGLAAMGVRFDRVLTSPWLRARETAKMLGPVFGGDPETTEALAEPPDSDFLAGLDSEDAESIALVGHEPWMSEIVAWLVTGDPADADGYVMKKGGVAWLAGEPRPAGMALRALVPPKVFRALYGA